MKTRDSSLEQRMTLAKISLYCILNLICSDNSNFDKQCTKLERYLLKNGYTEKMVKKQVLWARQHSKENPREKVKSEFDQKKLAFNIN